MEIWNESEERFYRERYTKKRLTTSSAVIGLRIAASMLGLRRISLAEVPLRLLFLRGGALGVA